MDDWIENTGKCPSPSTMKVDCILRNGDSRDGHYAENLRWKFNNDGFDIIKWRKWEKS